MDLKTRYRPTRQNRSYCVMQILPEGAEIQRDTEPQRQATYAAEMEDKRADAKRRVEHARRGAAAGKHAAAVARAGLLARQVEELRSAGVVGALALARELTARSVPKPSAREQTGSAKTVWTKAAARNLLAMLAAVK